MVCPFVKVKRMIPLCRPCIVLRHITGSDVFFRPSKMVRDLIHKGKTAILVTEPDVSDSEFMPPVSNIMSV